MKPILLFISVLFLSFAIRSVQAQSNFTIRTSLSPQFFDGDGSETITVNCNTTDFTVSANYKTAGGVTTSMSLNPSSASGPSGYSFASPPGNSPYILAVTTSNPHDGDLVVVGTDGSVTHTYTLHVRSTPAVSIGGSTPSIGNNSSGSLSGYIDQSKSPYTTVTWYSNYGVTMYGSNTYNMSNSGDNFSITVTTGAQGGSVYAVANNNCGSSPPSNTVNIGTPYTVSTTFNGSSGSSGTVAQVATLSILTNGTASGANWSVTNGSGSISPSGTSCNAYPNTFLRVVGAPTNSNGTGEEATFYVFKQGYMGMRAAYPNPTKNTMNVDFDDALMAQELVKEVALYNQKGKVVKQFDASKAASYFKESKSVVFNVQDLPSDTYYLHVQMGDKLVQSQIVVE